MRDDRDESGDRKEPSDLTRLRAHSDWELLHLNLTMYAFEINGRSLRGLEEFMQEGIKCFMEAYGTDIQALGGAVKAIPLLHHEVRKARDRQRQRKGEAKRKLLTPERFAALAATSSNPEGMLIEERVRTLEEQYIDLVTEKAAPYPCARLLMESLNGGDGKALALAAGFSPPEIYNERKRLKRLCLEAAEELGLGDEDEGTDGGEK